MSLKQGRPTKLTEDIRKVIMRCAELGYVDEEVSDIIGVSRQTIDNWKKKDPDFFASLKAAKKLADMEIVQTLRDCALGNVTITEEHEGIDASGNIVDKKIVKQIKPDVGAIKLWLFNRQADKWKERIDHTVSLDADKLELNFTIKSTDDV